MNSENSNNIMDGKLKKNTKKTSETPSDIVVFEDLENKFLHIKVGSDNHVATDVEIKDIQKTITSLFEKNNINCVAFVSHHAVSIDIIEKK